MMINKRVAISNVFNVTLLFHEFEGFTPFFFRFFLPVQEGEEDDNIKLLTKLIRKCSISLAYGVALSKKKFDEFTEYLKKMSLTQDEDEIRGKSTFCLRISLKYYIDRTLKNDQGRLAKFLACK